jgi:hypothetical protein
MSYFIMKMLHKYLKKGMRGTSLAGDGMRFFRPGKALQARSGNSPPGM